MKTLYLDQSGHLGGGEIALLPWLREARDTALVALFEDGPFRVALEQQGVPVTILIAGKIKKVRRESGLISSLAILPAYIRLSLQARKLARQVDVVYANSLKAFLVATLAKLPRQPLIWHLRDILSPEHFSPWLIRLSVAAGNFAASAIIVNSQATADAFIAAGGKRNKLTIVYDGIDPSAFAAVTPQAIAQARNDLAPTGRHLVGVFSRIAPWKGQDILLEAISTMPNVDAVIVGDALFGEEAFVDQLKARAAQPDLAGRIHFLGFRHDVPTLMKSVDIVAHTSISAEPFGLVILEGMLAEKPVIATRAGGAIEIMGNPQPGVPNAGFLVTPGSVLELRHALTILVEVPALAANLARAGRRQAERNFPLSAMFAGIEAVLATLDPNALQLPADDKPAHVLTARETTT